MGYAKVGQYVGSGRDHSGEVVVADISIPHGSLRTPRAAVSLVESSDVRAVLPGRSRRAHKYEVGKVLVVGGSRSFTGAPALAALAALRSGAGAVILGVPRSLHQLMARKLQEVIVVPLPETADGTVGADAFDELRGRFSWADVVALGPGLGRNSETDSLVCQLLAGSQTPVIVDADALTSVGSRTSVLSRRNGETALTPHAGELSRLTGAPAAAIEATRVESARNAARRFRSVVVLKGSPTATAAPKGEVFLNPTGNPGMATIGSGDVLTGLLAGLRSQGMNLLEAAWSAAYLHGLAGDLGAARFGMRSLVASDLVEALPSAFTACEAE
jgi:NAD(P)H-hydrate epimerase